VDIDYYKHRNAAVVCRANKKSSGSKSSPSGGFGRARAPTTEKKSCPCGSRKAYSACCQPFHDHKALPPTPEALMRSRYSAYSLSLVDYIVETTHPENPLLQKDNGVSLRKDAASTCKKISWDKLVVMDTEDVSESEGTVTFQTYFKVRGQQGQRSQGFHVQTFIEKSTFLKEDGKWLYVDGDQDWEVNGWVGGL
jgi:SEC-C motif-containing protein